MIELQARELTAYHDSRHAIAGWAKSGAAVHRSGPWQAIEDNHRCNCLLWDEEDLARRRQVPDAEIAANKRAIDGHNQKRNDAIERIDEVDRLADSDRNRDHEIAPDLVDDRLGCADGI